MPVRAFSLLHQCPPRCSRPFGRTKDNHTPCKPGSSRVASSDLLDFAPSQDIWALGQTPINVKKLQQLLKDYPNKSDAVFLSEGFEFGFKLHYEGPRDSVESKNLKSVLQNEEFAKEKLEQEIALGRMAGPFPYKPISNLRFSPIGLVPKKTGGVRIINHLSYPAGSSVNDGIDDALWFS